MSQYDTDELVFWSRMVDEDIWEVLVRIGNVFMFQGSLEVWDNRTTTLIHQETVSLPIEVLFGREVPEWETWQTAALDVIDNPEKRHVWSSEEDSSRDKE